MDDFPAHRWHAITAPLARLMPQQICRSCQQQSPQGALCNRCRNTLTRPQRRCHRCAHPLPGSITGPTLCGECLNTQPPFQRTITAVDYVDPASHWVNRFKHQRELRDGHLLSQLLLQSLKREYLADQWPDLMVPVPLHWRRTLSRSFNQAAWISHCLQKRLPIPAQHCIKRTSRAHTQQGLSRKQRLRNLEGAFHIIESRRALLQGQHVALIDDVVTTAATVRTLSQLLLSAGASRVDVWCLARTASPSQSHRER